MEPATESISVRSTRLNEIVGGSSIMATATMNRELLMDTIVLLFEECNNEHLRSYPHIENFVNKFKMVIPELKSLRVNRLDFESRQVIGKGHFGNVELVVEKHTKDIFAMKVLKKHIFLNQRDITSFEYERDIMASSSSPFFTQLYYAFQDYQNLYLVMDYHPGGDFANLINNKFNGMLPEETAKFYIAELLLAVKHLHTMGFAHRDIKPENMMLNRVGHLKLVDFGSSAKLNRDGKINSHVYVGTPEYLAPEVFNVMQSNSNSVDGYGPQCDLWSVGIVAYKMATGVTPFISEQQACNFTNKLKFDQTCILMKYPISSKVSQSYKQMIECLVCHVDKRFTVDMMLDLKIFSKFNINSLHDEVPPYIPSLMSNDDVSNFPVHDRVRPVLNKNDFKKQKQFSGRDLPFIGFTYCMPVTKRSKSYFTTNNPELETTMIVNRKKLEDAQVLIQAYEEKLAEYATLYAENERKIKQLEKDNVLLKVDVTSFNSNLSRLPKLNKTSDTSHENYIIEKKQAEKVQNETDRRKVESSNKLCNIQELKTLNENLKVQNTELKSDLSKYDLDFKMYQTNEEKLKKEVNKLQLKLKDMSLHSEQLTEDNNIAKHVATLMSDLKLKEDAFEVEKNQLTANNQFLKKKILTLETDLDNLNLKMDQYAKQEIFMLSEHDKICKKMTSDFELKLNSVNQEKDNTIDKLHSKIVQLQQQYSKLLISFEKNENAILEKKTEKEYKSELRNREHELDDLKLNLRILQQKYKTSEDTISNLREFHEDTQNNFKKEIAEIQEKNKLKIKDKENELKSLQDKITSLIQTIESLQLKLEKEIKERQRLCDILSKTNNDSKVWTSTKSALERQILEFKTNFNYSEANIKKLKELVTAQNKQLDYLGESVQILQNKEKQLLENLKMKQIEIEKIQNECCKANKMCDEKKLYTDQDYKENIDIDLIKEQIDELNTELRNKNTMFFTLEINYENAVKELNRFRVEKSDTISQKQLLKEANTRLKLQLEAIVEDSNVLQNIITKYKNSLMEQKVYYEERFVKADATIHQQTKLIDFLQTKLDEVTKKKKTLGEMLFSSKSKENIDQKEIESLLNSERSKAKDLSNKLYQTQVELNMLRTQSPFTTSLAPICLSSESTSPAYNKTTPCTKSKPVLKFHNFDVKICKSSGLRCVHCQVNIICGQQISECQECRVSTHVTCSHELLSDCTIFNKEEKPTESVPNDNEQNCEIESWVTIWDNTEQIWDRKYAKFQQGVLEILNDKHNSEPFYTLSLLMSSNVVRVVDVANSNDSTFNMNTNEDYEQMFKIEVYNLNTGWMTLFLYIILSSVSEKSNWLRVIKEFLEENECTTQLQQNHVYKDIICTFKKDNFINVNCVYQITQKVFLLGADEGLFSVHIKTQNAQIKHELVSIVGPKLVKDVLFLPKIQLVLMVAGITRDLFKCNMQTVVLNSELSSVSKPVIEVVSIIDELLNNKSSKSSSSELKEINCIAASRCNELVVVGSEHSISVLKWQDTNFIVAKFLKTNVPTKCICFMSTKIVFSTNSFYKIETDNFSCKRFFSDSVAKSHDYRPMFMCELSKNKEFLLCYDIYGVFVDADGQRMRSGVIKWPYIPKSFAFKNPYLIIVSEYEISIIKITQSCCVDEDTWSITSNKQSEDQVILNINHSSLLGGNNICLKNTNDYLGTCTIFQLDPPKFMKSSMTSNDTLDTLDTQETSDKSEFSFTSSMFENIDEELEENQKKVSFNPYVQFNNK